MKGNENFPKDSLDIQDIFIFFGLQEKGEGLNAREISEKVEIPLSSTYKHLSDLEEGGFIEKTDKFYKLTQKTKRQLFNLKGWDLDWLFTRNKSNKQRVLRFHALQGRLRVISPPRNYEQYLNKYMKIPVGRNKALTGFKLQTNGCLVIFYNPTSISVTFPDVLVDSLEVHRVAEGYCKLSLVIDALVSQLESLFPGLKIDEFIPFDLDNQHIAIKDSKYAKNYFQKNGEPLNENGRIITDRSHGHHELEAVNPVTAGQDIEECLRREQDAQEND
jgi:DNA-binding MarR family transcriptional regulator